MNTVYPTSHRTLATAGAIGSLLLGIFAAFPAVTTVLAFTLRLNFFNLNIFDMFFPVVAAGFGAIILGIISFNMIKRQGADGKSLAQAGIALGVIGLSATFIIIILIAQAFSGMALQ